MTDRRCPTCGEAYSASRGHGCVLRSRKLRKRYLLRDLLCDVALFFGLALIAGGLIRWGTS